MKTGIGWTALKQTAADGKTHCHAATLGLEFRHNPQTKMRAESIEVHDGNDAIKIHRDTRVKSGWTKPYLVSWR